MRITGGTYRGRRVRCPKGVIRPAMDRMRESMFSILGPLDGYSFLDIFSGSGLVGIEAASRGAEPVVLVENDRGKRETILENIEIVESKISLVMMSAESFLRRGRGSFDIIYLDPPFPMPGKIDLIKKLSDSSLITDETKVLIHHPAEEQWPDKVGTLVCYDTRRYGRSLLRFFRPEV
ncbi:16S rRNA (guanine(966)-N(2))-methyltransferase RsmD [Sediminispirochaeta bajacaliforniensis]|uniref:16S rRNA (guanine(966)-N(2))-methyltransferase RsmD n=1 Tax=Sediminispirochaeta bajacaliforniensis TaxID=148 RepID=UPI0003AAAB03|nr:16S rRNA (guanine(966)-N(2))-methyltransferase RsmD [Sediminispirochaeta bajacaliforniensis]